MAITATSVIACTPPAPSACRSVAVQLPYSCRTVAVQLPYWVGRIFAFFKRFQELELIIFTRKSHPPNTATVRQLYGNCTATVRQLYDNCIFVLWAHFHMQKHENMDFVPVFPMFCCNWIFVAANAFFREKSLEAGRQQGQGRDSMRLPLGEHGGKPEQTKHRRQQKPNRNKTLKKLG